MTTLGEELSDLLQRNGIPGPILCIEGGPGDLKVSYYLLNADGKKFFDEHGDIAMQTVTLDLRAEAVSA